SVRNLGGAGAGHLGAADGLATLTDAGPLAHLLAQVVELGAADVAVPQHLDPVDARRVHQEGALHADAVGDPAHREGRPQAGLAAERDDHALEHLDALTGTLDDLDVHAHGVAAAQHRYLGLLLLALEQVDDVHHTPPAGAPSRTSSGRRRLIRCSLCSRRQRSIAA